MVRGFSRFVLFLFLSLLRAPTRNSPERVPDTIWTCPEKSGKPPGLETPRFSFSQSLANFGKPTHSCWLSTTFTSSSLTFTRVPAKVPHIYQSSREGAFCTWVTFIQNVPTEFLKYVIFSVLSMVQQNYISGWELN